MLKDITIGQFFPGDSAVHRLDPRVKIVLTVAFIVLLFLANGPVSYAIILAFLAIIIGISRISPKMVVRGLKPVLFIVMFTALLNLFYTPGDYIWQWGFSAHQCRGYPHGHLHGHPPDAAHHRNFDADLYHLAHPADRRPRAPALAAQKAACACARAFHDDVDRAALYPDPD